MVAMKLVVTAWLFLVAAGAAQAFDVEKFFAENFIVDGLGTYYDNQGGQGHPYPSEEGPWDLAPLKSETGCNMVIMSYSTVGSFEGQARRFAAGNV